MSTKYILHGGEAQKINPENDSFFEEILRDFPVAANVLLVQFAADTEKQEVYKERNISQFERVKNGRKINYQIASEKEFVHQIDWANVVYFGGGTTSRLLNVLNKFSGLSRLFEGKTIAGESAGANCLSVYCYSKSGGVLRGLGCVPVKIIPHYQPGDEEKLSSVSEQIDGLFLSNCQFRIFVL